PIDPWNQLFAAITAVFNSWTNERASTYRKHHKIEGLLGTAVTVQMMCPSEVSGVMFTANPVNPALEQIVIESSYGLGEAIASGKVTPDRFVLDKKTLALQERNISKKDYQVASLGQGEPEGVSPRSADTPSLTDAQIRELAQLGLRVESYFKTPATSNGPCRAASSTCCSRARSNCASRIKVTPSLKKCARRKSLR